MNNFVHRVLGHFYMNEADGDGSDLGGSADDAGDQDDDDQGDGGDAGDDDRVDGDEDDDDGVIVTIGDEKPPVEDEEEKTAPKWVKDLRKQTKEQARLIRELQAEKAASAAPATKTPELGPKPTLEDSDWDAEDFEVKLTEWHDRKRKVEQEKAKAVEQQEAQQKEWQGKLTRYTEAQSNLKARDFADVEESVKGILDETQLAIIVQAAKDPALMVYAIGKNPKKAAELASLKNYVEFAYALGELSKDMKVTTRKAAPPPEGKVRGGNAPVSGSVDSNLERLRADAEKTGDYSKVGAYRRAQKEKQKA